MRFTKVNASLNQRVLVELLTLQMSQLFTNQVNIHWYEISLYARM